MIQISSQEIIENGKSVVYYKTGLMPARKCLLPVNNFERAIEIERIIKQAINWKRFSFSIERVQESWDKFYYKLLLNGEFLITNPCLTDLREEIYSVMNKLGYKDYSISVDSLKHTMREIQPLFSRAS